MIQKIISNLPEARDIILAAQNLVNEQFRLNAASMGASNKLVRNHLKERQKKFMGEIEKSPLLSAEEKKVFFELSSKEVYERARGIILQLTEREIKPLGK